jgi:four helix bundle protein
VNEKNEYIMSKQLHRSGTAIGAMVREAEHTESKADIIHKLSIALKEANESEYWLELLHNLLMLMNLNLILHLLK